MLVARAKSFEREKRDKGEMEKLQISEVLQSREGLKG